MASGIFSDSFAEGFSTNRPPLFSGTNYTSWKSRMITYIQSVDYSLWRLIEKGPHVPMKVVDRVEVAKTSDEFDERDDAMMSKNAKVMNILHCAMDREQYVGISHCKSAKEIWCLLEATHEGTSKVKETKLGFLHREFELFTMKPEETIQSMYQRLSKLLSDLSMLGKEFSLVEKNRKILNALPTSWKPKVTAIKEARDLNVYTTAELIGSLLAEELEIEQEKGRMRNVAFTSTSRRGEQERSSSEDEVAIISRSFKKLMKGKKMAQSSKNQNLKKSKGKKKNGALISTWDDPSFTKGEQNEESCHTAFTHYNHLCLMANEEEVQSQSDVDSDNEELSIDELYELLNEMHDQLKLTKSSNKKLRKQLDDALCAKETIMCDYSSLKDKHDMLVKEHDLCAKNATPCDYDCLNEKYVALVKEHDELNIIVEKFTKGRDNFNVMLGAQKLSFDRSGIGYMPTKKQKSFDSYFVKCAPIRDNQYTHKVCTYCMKVGHMSSKCNVRQIVEKGDLVPRWRRPRWIVKSNATNLHGPKETWVPKSSI